MDFQETSEQWTMVLSGRGFVSSSPIQTTEERSHTLVKPRKQMKCLIHFPTWIMRVLSVLIMTATVVSLALPLRSNAIEMTDIFVQERQQTIALNASQFEDAGEENGIQLYQSGWITTTSYSGEYLTAVNLLANVPLVYRLDIDIEGYGVYNTGWQGNNLPVGISELNVLAVNVIVQDSRPDYSVLIFSQDYGIKIPQGFELPDGWTGDSYATPEDLGYSNLSYQHLDITSIPGAVGDVLNIVWRVCARYWQGVGLYSALALSLTLSFIAYFLYGG